MRTCLVFHRLNTNLSYRWKGCHWYFEYQIDSQKLRSPLKIWPAGHWLHLGFCTGQMRILGVFSIHSRQFRWRLRMGMPIERWATGKDEILSFLLLIWILWIFNGSLENTATPHTEWSLLFETGARFHNKSNNLVSERYKMTLFPRSNWLSLFVLIIGRIWAILRFDQKCSFARKYLSDSKIRITLHFFYMSKIWERV